MPYDDPNLMAFSGYFEAKEPGRRERAASWATAIGLQKVDGLITSDYLIEIAKRHIEGEISADKARSIVDCYYETKAGLELPEDVREADKVAARIIEVIDDGAFYFDPSYLKGLHGLIFEGVFAHAGSYREINLRKHEWVLKEDSVTYGPWRSIESNLEKAFEREREFSYAGVKPREMVAHFTRFISQLWQIHPFREGNTRTMAVFAVKYLRMLNIPASNDIFAENSWFFRNALVRANYDNPLKGVQRDFVPLEGFFRNLVLGERNQMKSRFLLIDLDSSKRSELERGHGGRDKTRKRSEKSGQKKAVRKRGQKTVDRLIGVLQAHPHLTQMGLVKALGISSRSTVQKHLANLKKAGRIRRVGPDKGGYWEVLPS